MAAPIREKLTINALSTCSLSKIAHGDNMGSLSKFRITNKYAIFVHAIKQLDRYE
jgi:hypothetical protein